MFECYQNSLPTFSRNLEYQRLHLDKETFNREILVWMILPWMVAIDFQAGT